MAMRVLVSFVVSVINASAFEIFKFMIQIWVFLKSLFSKNHGSALRNETSVFRSGNDSDTGPGTRVANYDVFISHRGKDVKNTLVAHIYDLLQYHHVRAFLDREEIEPGEGLTSIIQEAIQSATVQIVIFSKNYAQSTWCLRELALMLESNAEIIPVFYDVSPQEVRWVKGTFAEAFKKHRKRVNRETINKWKAALSTASNISGLSLSEYQWKLGKKIVDEVLKKVNYQPLHTASNIVGLKEQVARLTKFVLESRVETQDVTVVGIVGMGGIGKTTLAKALYNSIRSEFRTASYVDDVKGTVQSNGLQCVQMQLLRDLLHLDNGVPSIGQGKYILTNRLKNADVLIAFDNIDDFSQMEDALLDVDVLSPRSVIIFTTRDMRILKFWKNSLIFELDELNPLQSEKLFCRHAFHRDFATGAFENLVEKFLNICNGLPLALEISGRQLYDESYEICEGVYNKFCREMPPEIKRILEWSYEQLDNKQKELFLDIAVFLNGEDKDTVTRILEGSTGSTLHDLQILVKKCMVKLNGTRLKMHHLLSCYGREIAEKECIQEPSRRSRLWTSSDVKNALKDCSEGKSIRGLSLVSGGLVVWNEDRAGNRCAWPTDSFVKLRELQLLILEDACIEGNEPKLPPHLRWLRWWRFPYKLIPATMEMKQLRVLDFCEGKLVSLWDDADQLPINLRELNLARCRHLQRVPDFIGKLIRLEKIDFSECKFLEALPESVCNLGALQHLNLSGCSSLQVLPNGFGKLRSLKFLNLSHCYNLKVLPNSFGQLRQIQYLYMEGCKKLEITEMSFISISTLVEVKMGGCEKLEKLPPQITSQSSLKALGIGGSCCPIKELPDDIGRLSALECLQLRGLKALREIPDSIANLSALKELTLSDCPTLKGFPPSILQLANLSTLQLYFCGLLHQPLQKITADLRGLSFLRQLQQMPRTSGNSKLQCLDGFQKLHVFVAGVVPPNNTGLWLQNWPSVSEISCTARVIPHVTSRPDFAGDSSELKMEKTSEGLQLQLPNSEGCVAVVIFYVFAFFLDKFDEDIGVPPARIDLYPETLESHSVPGLGEFIHVKVLSPGLLRNSGSNNVIAVRPFPYNRKCRLIVREGWVHLIERGAERRIQDIFERLTRHQPVSAAHSNAPSQLDLRSLYALNIANCRVRRIFQLANTPLQEEEMEERLCRNKHLFCGHGDSTLQYLDASSSFNFCTKFMANFYRLEVSTIRSNGAVAVRNEAQELLNVRDDDLADETIKRRYGAVLRILESRKIFKNELERITSDL